MRSYSFSATWTCSHATFPCEHLLAILDLHHTHHQILCSVLVPTKNGRGMHQFAKINCKLQLDTHVRCGPTDNNACTKNLS